MRIFLYYVLFSLIIVSCSDDDTPKESIPQDSLEQKITTIDSSSFTKTKIDPVSNKRDLKGNNSFVNSDYDDKNERIVDHSIFTDGNTFVVQESAFRKEERAIKQATKLREDGYDTFITTVTFEDGQIWFRVRIGYFESITDAIKFKRKLLNILNDTTTLN